MFINSGCASRFRFRHKKLKVKIGKPTQKPNITHPVMKSLGFKNAELCIYIDSYFPEDFKSFTYAILIDFIMLFQNIFFLICLSFGKILDLQKIESNSISTINTTNAPAAITYIFISSIKLTPSSSFYMFFYTPPIHIAKSKSG